MNNPPTDGPWIRRVPPRRLAVFAAVAALYVGVYAALFLGRTREYLIAVAQAFPFARRWLDWIQ